MASFTLLQHTEPRFQSPAKVFAKLKSKVQKEAMCAKEFFFASTDIPCTFREKPGAEFHSPRKKTASWTAEELKESQKFSSYSKEAQALTLSPISSPQKTFDYTCSVISSRPLEGTFLGNENVRGYTRRDRSVLESTAVSQPPFLVNRDQIYNRTRQIIDTGDYNVSNTTPVKPVENYGKNVFDTKCCPLSKHKSPGNAFSPMKKRLRKRKWEQQELTKDSTTAEVRNEDVQPPQPRKTSAFSQDNTHNNVRGLSSNQPEMRHKPTIPPRSAIEKCSSVVHGTYPIMSPAKMFAYMKERESKKEQQEVHNSSKRDLFCRGNLHHSGDIPLSTARNVAEMKSFGGALEKMVSVSPCRADSSDWPSETVCSDDGLIPAAPQPILLEDPLVLNSPQISIPKTQEPVFKRNCWPKQKKFPLENVIYLKKWFLRKSHKGLFVDGIHTEENIPWNSNIIVDRISNSVLRTVTGRVYILVGKMKMDVASDFPKWLLKKFASGFPPNWKTLYEQFLQESIEAERNNEGPGIKGKTNPDVSSINHSVNEHKQKSMKTREYEDVQPPQPRKTSAFSQDNTHNNVRGLSSNQPEMRHKPTIPPRSAIEKCSSVVHGTYPIMSPAKMFAYMKERESKKEQQEVHNSSKRDLFCRGNLHHSGDIPLSTARNVAEMKSFGGALEKMVSVSPCRADSSDWPSETVCSDDGLIPAAPQPILLEDPLVLNSPQISIPKTQEPVFKRNCWPKQKKFPLENVIYLKKWFLRKSHKGLFVDGIHTEENIPWNSNIIVDRISNSVLRTVTGRVYILVGKMKMDVASDFPKWLLKKFASGFPPNWKTLYEQFLQESIEAERNNEGPGIKGKTNPDVSSINHSVNEHKQKSMKTPDSRPPTSSSSIKMSRSGRIIKPPLDYWKGGRIIVDAHMNVTIHECYDTYQSETSTIVTPSASQKPVRVIAPRSKGWEQSKSAIDKRTPVPVRRVKAVRNCTKSVVSPCKKAATVIEPAVETLSSPEEWCGRRTKSSQRRLHAATERELYVNAAPQKQSEPSTQRSKQQTHDINRRLTRASVKKRTVKNSSESPPLNNKTLEHLSSDEAFSSNEKKRLERVHVKKRGKNHKKSQPDHKPSPKESPEYSEEERKAQRKRSRETRKRDEAQTKHKESKSTKKSPRAKLSLKQSSKKDQPNKGSTIIPQDEDEWTEAELMALQEAVSYYPKNITSYWANIARMVGTRSAKECHEQHTSLRTSHTPAKRANKKVAEPKLSVPEHPVVSARVGTFKRKQQVRQFLQSQPKEDVDDAFSSAYMQNKRVEIPSLCLSDDHDFQMDLEPQTPRSSHFPEVKTPQCLHITPGMMGSPNANNDDKYVYQLQKRMKKNQFNVRKNSPSSKRFTPTPSMKRRMRRCGNTENDTFVVWEMLAEDDEVPSESGEEDFYFSDN